MFFCPAETTAVTDVAAGKDWGGIMVEPYFAGTLIQHADIGYAANPLFMYYPDSLTTVRNTRVHHFADTGIWIYGSVGQGGVIDTCTVTRGAGLHPTLGGVGVFLDQAPDGNLVRSLVDLSGLNRSAGGFGVYVSFGKTLCDTEPTEYDDLALQGNEVRGPGPDVQFGTAYSGVKLDWICGDPVYRDVAVVTNKVHGWKWSGFDLDQCSDVQITCNTVLDNQRAVWINRDATQGSSGPPMRFDDNWFEVRSHDKELLRTNKPLKTALGPSVGGKGDNALMVVEATVDFIVNTELQYVPAQDNYWFLYQPSVPDTLFVGNPADSLLIKNQIVGLVTFTPFRGDTVSMPTCEPSHVAWQLGPGVAEIGEDRPPLGEEASIPLQTTLKGVLPNPSRGRVGLALGVAPGGEGRYSLEVFDIRGRRIARAERDLASPGWYSLEWTGRDAQGRRTAAGVYFVRVTGPGLLETRKVTILR